MQKTNWAFKRKINLLMQKMARFPVLCRLLIRLIWSFRYATRLFSMPKRDLKGGVFVNKHLNLLLIGNPKVGSSTLKRTFSNMSPKSELYINASYDDFLIGNNETGSFEKVFFIRNIYERVYSCWQDKISNNKRFADIFIITRFSGLYPDMSFDDFVNWLNTEAGSDKYADRHWVSQHLFLGHELANLEEIQIRNLHEMDEFIATLKNKLEVKSDLNAVNRLGTNDVDMLPISNNAKKGIETRYAKDFELFSKYLES